MTYIPVRQLLPRLHNLCHVDSRVTMLRYSLKGLAQAKIIKKSVILFRVLIMTI